MEEEDVALNPSPSCWRHYTVFEGLTGMQVEDIYQDAVGFIWVATADHGVSRFDGVHFDNLTAADGLPHPCVMALAGTGDGRLWLATLGGGLAVREGRQVRVFTTADGLPSDELLGLRPEADGALLVCTRRGVAWWDGKQVVDRITEVAGSPLGPVYDALCDGGGRLWLATAGRGVLDRNGQRLSPEGICGEEALQWVWKLSTDAQGRLWMASLGAHLYCYDPATERLKRLEVDHPARVRSGVRHLRLDGRGRIWVAYGRAGYFDGKGWTWLTPPGASGATGHTRLTFEDREGHLWIGLWGGGLLGVDLRGRRWISCTDELAGAAVTHLAQGQDGVIWAGTSRGLACLRDGEMTLVSEEPVLSLSVDRQGRVWTGTPDGRVGCREANEKAALRIGAPDQEVTALATDGQDRLWIGLYQGGLGWLEGKEWKRLPADLPWIQALAADGQDRLWIGLHGAREALYCCERNGVRAVTWGDLAHVRYVWVLCAGADGTLWVGTELGLFALREDQVRHFTVADGLPTNGVKALAEDGQGHLWIGTGGGGAVRYDGVDFHGVSLGASAAGNGVEAVLVDRTGQVWFGTQAGLVAYIPGRVPPTVVIRQAVADQVWRDPAAFTCVESVPAVRIAFQGIGFRAGPRQMQYSWRLAPGEWSVFSRDTEAVYQGLVVGEYCFEVKARDSDGRVSEPARLPFAVEPDPQQERLAGLQEALGRPWKALLGESAAMRRVGQQLRAAADTDMLVLIGGETGAGKGLAARWVHAWSRRRAGPFLQVNCGSIPNGVVESELFGHEKGAFTGAVARRLGLFELADGGTLFLDEIGDLPLEQQGRLLLVLEEGWIQRVGGEQPIPVDVRVVAATNRDLARAVQEGRFREDLYFRLQGYPVLMPPLRARPEDIPRLAQHIIEVFAAHLKRESPHLSPAALRRLGGYAWPGNVRELEHTLQRAVLKCRGGEIRKEDIEVEGACGAGALEVVSLAEHERRYLHQVLALTGGVIHGERGAAQLLGMNPSTLRSRLRKLGIPFGRRWGEWENGR